MRKGLNVLDLVAFSKARIPPFLRRYTNYAQETKISDYSGGNLVKNRVILINSQLKKIVLSRKKSFCFSLPLGQWNDIKRKGPERQEGDNGTRAEHHFCPQRTGSLV